MENVRSERKAGRGRPDSVIFNVFGTLTSLHEGYPRFILGLARPTSVIEWPRYDTLLAAASVLAALTGLSFAALGGFAFTFTVLGGHVVSFLDSILSASSLN